MNMCLSIVGPSPTHPKPYTLNRSKRIHRPSSNRFQDGASFLFGGLGLLVLGYGVPPQGVLRISSRSFISGKFSLWLRHAQTGLPEPQIILLPS